MVERLGTIVFIVMAGLAAIGTVFLLINGDEEEANEFDTTDGQSPAPDTTVNPLERSPSVDDDREGPSPIIEGRYEGGLWELFEDTLPPPTGKHLEVAQFVVEFEELYHAYDPTTSLNEKRELLKGYVTEELWQEIGPYFSDPEVERALLESGETVAAEARVDTRLVFLYAKQEAQATVDITVRITDGSGGISAYEFSRVCVLVETNDGWRVSEIVYG